MKKKNIHKAISTLLGAAGGGSLGYGLGKLYGANPWITTGIGALGGGGLGYGLTADGKQSDLSGWVNTAVNPLAAADPSSIKKPDWFKPFPEETENFNKVLFSTLALAATYGSASAALRVAQNILEKADKKPGYSAVSAPLRKQKETMLSEEKGLTKEAFDLDPKSILLGTVALAVGAGLTYPLYSGYTEWKKRKRQQQPNRMESLYLLAPLLAAGGAGAAGYSIADEMLAKSKKQGLETELSELEKRQKQLDQEYIKRVKGLTKQAAENTNNEALMDKILRLSKGGLGVALGAAFLSGVLGGKLYFDTKSKPRKRFKKLKHIMQRSTPVTASKEYVYSDLSKLEQPLNKEEDKKKEQKASHVSVDI